MKEKVNIGGQDIELTASVWTWICYKKIFKRDWNADRDKSLAAIRKANFESKEFIALAESVQKHYIKGEEQFDLEKLSELQKKQYFKEIDEEFAKLPKEKQEAYWKSESENSVDMDFALDTIYAMAIAGGYSGTQKDLFINLSPKELSPDSELMQTFAELSCEFNIEVKKNTIPTNQE